ncbi:MAG: LPS export ABC transporter periplasmic protein LptC [Phascolarctobacterium sp.]|nr:LPS export ABC transporter periplasmic protein LptC [Phascolarctobacterium sp.]MBR6636756.1 LPS export ABC transporter periplasmic protein LptC [Phascolarctobacterium sp.]MBR6679551.1 LPS export ABC transporter periplasmic protein LptC [Phascolarctobacterium sp.]
MKKMLLAATLAASMCVPAYANYSNSGDGVYNAPEYDSAVSTTRVVEPTEKEKNMDKPLPINFTGDKAEYDSVSGDFYLQGNVVITQGKEILKTTYAQGNMKTGDVWLEQGGTIIEPGSTLSGKWAYYNFNTKTGEIKEVHGTGDKDWYSAPHATIHPDKMVLDEGGTMSRCPAVNHVPCLSVTAKTFEIYPKQKMVAKDVKVYVKGKHIYSKDIWVRDLTETNKTRIIPRIGYDGSDNGAFIKIDAEWNFGEKTKLNVDLPYYTKADFKPMVELEHDERNFSLTYKTGWEEDDDDWYKKQNNWKFEYKPHHFIDGLPLSYSGYFEYGLWKNDNTGRKSWHKEYAAFLRHDPIYLFGSKNTVLDLTVGKKWVHESYTDDTNATDLYYAVLSQKIASKWSTWVGWYREDITTTLFDIGQPDMDQELRNGLRYKADDKNIFTVINRYDLDNSTQYETNYRWLHRFCCWALEFEYEKEHHGDHDDSFKVYYYFYNL